jgi:uncharacterized protein (DUF1697 family)
MGVFVALYRGINVVGRNSVKMESLRAMHERMGHRQVISYIQSGNVIFVAKASAATIARQLTARFAKQFGFAAKVLVVDARQLAAIVAGNPYASIAVERPNTVHVGICQSAPDAAGLTALFTRARTTEAFELGQGVLYLHAPDGFGQSKFASGMERACGVTMTVRNWRTIQTLSKMAEELDKVGAAEGTGGGGKVREQD